MRGESLPEEVDDLVMYLVLECNDETSVAADDRVSHRKVLQATISNTLKVSGVTVITIT